MSMYFSTRQKKVTFIQLNKLTFDLLNIESTMRFLN